MPSRKFRDILKNKSPGFTEQVDEEGERQYLGDEGFVTATTMLASIEGVLGDITPRGMEPYCLPPELKCNNRYIYCTAGKKK